MTTLRTPDVARSIDARLRALSREIGWALTTLKNDRGQVIQVHSLTLLDAFIRVQLHGADPGLDRDLTRFLSTYRVKQSDGAMVQTLRVASRAIWFPLEHAQEEQAAHALARQGTNEVVSSVQTVVKRPHSQVPPDVSGSINKPPQRPTQNVSDGVATGARGVGVPVARTRNLRPNGRRP
jgi:hypothetical protein